MGQTFVVKSSQTATTKGLTVDKGKSVYPCLACNNGSTNMKVVLHSTDTCAVWNSLSMADKRSKVSCLKHPFPSRDGQTHSTSNCTFPVKKCKHCGQKGSHHHLLCPTKKGTTMLSKKVCSSLSTLSQNLSCYRCIV